MKTPPIELMEILIATAETKNLYQAAERLEVSQALISVKLKGLESLMPFPVFGLQGRKKVMTKFGRDLYELALQQSHQWKNSIEQLNRRYGDADQLTIKIGGRPETVEAFIHQSDFEGCLNLQAMSSTEAIEKLLQREIDIAISYKVPDSAEVIAKKIFESSAQLLVHRKWIKGKSMDQSQNQEFLLNTPCILYTEKGWLIREWLKHLEIPFDKLRVKIISEDWRTIQRLVEEKKGFSIVPSYLRSDQKDLISWPLPITVLPKYVFYACFHKDLKKIPALRKLVFQSLDAI
jgi:DNA-binding transcriptional LysR family regulator